MKSCIEGSLIAPGSTNLIDNRRFPTAPSNPRHAIRMESHSLAQNTFPRTPSWRRQADIRARTYFVIEMRADDLMSLGVTFKPRPLPDDPGHTVIPELNIKVIDAPSAVMIRDRARRLPFKAHGPYPGSRPQN